MLAILQQRVREDPAHADSWRLIAKLHHREGESAPAIEALRRALAVDPESVASHFDLGEVLESIGDSWAASDHYSTVIRLAPESSYARKLTERGFTPDSVATSEASLAMNSDAVKVEPVAYEIQTFDGSESFERQLEGLASDERSPLDRWRVFAESGLLYNTNLSLTPISRQLVDVDASAFQGFLNPEIEFMLINRPDLRVGPLIRGYFSLNERHQSDFDLAAFQGGWFAERDRRFLGREIMTRLDYVYSLDLQGGSRFGDRHSLTASATSVSTDGDIVYLYGTLSMTDFEDDGTVPTLDSLDGPGFIGGVTRFFQTDWDRLPTFRLGADLSAANTEGADFRYVGAGLSGAFTTPLGERLTIEPEVGLGFRVYDDYIGPVDRDEIVIRLAIKAERQVSEHLAVAVVVGYDRFASDNEDFDAERTEGGIVASWRY